MYILENYIKKFLKPTYNQEAFIRSKSNSIISVMRNNTELSLREARKGGSFEKGTMLKYHQEADIVLIFNKLPGRKRNWNNLMEIVKISLLENFPESKIVESGIIRHKIVFNNNGEKTFFDIVPSYHVEHPLQMPSHSKSKIYQGITTIWHIEYYNKFKNLPNFINAMMLLKDWKNENKIPLKSFHLEFILISAYNKRVENKYSIIDILKGCFKEIQGMLDGKSIFPVDWNYFSESDIVKNRRIPCIIDPANPKDNLLKNIEEQECKNLRKKVINAINQIDNEEYGKIFDPNNYTEYFMNM